MPTPFATGEIPDFERGFPDFESIYNSMTLNLRGIVKPSFSMIRNFLSIASTVLFSTALISCNSNTASDSSQQENKDSVRIVSLSGAVTETLSGLGMEHNIVGVDVTSTYPESINAKPKVGNTHNLNVEAILSMKPDYVISMKERGIKPEQATQLEQAGIKVWVLEQEYSIEGTKNLISRIADSFQRKEEAQKMIAGIDEQMKSLPQYDTKPSVLFIYARGAGALSVCGDDMPMAKMIVLAGGVNAASDVQGFKPLTSEALVKQNPDAILLFNTGLESLDGPEGMLKVPGVAQTNAGKNKNFIVMDGELLSSFGPRVALAVKELGSKIHAAAPAPQP